jgi:hypothetical protein
MHSDIDVTSASGDCRRVPSWIEQHTHNTVACSTPRARNMAQPAAQPPARPGSALLEERLADCRTTSKLNVGCAAAWAFFQPHAGMQARPVPCSGLLCILTTSPRVLHACRYAGLPMLPPGFVGLIQRSNPNIAELDLSRYRCGQGPVHALLRAVVVLAGAAAAAASLPHHTPHPRLPRASPPSYKNAQQRAHRPAG